MKIMFFTLVKMTSFDDSGIYADMVKEFVKKGHSVDYYFPLSNSFKLSGLNYSLNSIKINQKIQKTNNFIFKFFTYLFIQRNFLKIIEKSFENYDLLLIVTPSIFQTKIVKTFKLKYPKSKTLLLLKDIFPDNAVNLGLIKNKFPMAFLYRYFSYIESNLYNNADRIGVMTKLNNQYILDKSPNLEKKIFISPNSIQFYSITQRSTIHQLGIPDNKIVITFIGNIGIPQDPDKIKELIINSPSNFFFVLIGTGSKERDFKNLPISKVLFINQFLPQNEIDQYLLHSNYGLVMLSAKFTIPNFPSKILSYINANLPIIAITNYFNDLRELIHLNKIPGFWFNSDSNIGSDLFHTLEKNIGTFKMNNFDHIKKSYSVQNQINGIINQVKEDF